MQIVFAVEARKSACASLPVARYALIRYAGAWSPTEFQFLRDWLLPSVSLRGSNIDLLHVLVGTILAIDATALCFIGAITSFTVIVLAVIYRPLLFASVDPDATAR